MDYDIKKYYPSAEEMRIENEDYINGILDEMKERGLNVMMFVTKGKSHITAGALDPEALAEHFVALFVTCEDFAIQAIKKMKDIGDGGGPK